MRDKPVETGICKHLTCRNRNLSYPGQCCGNPNGAKSSSSSKQDKEWRAHYALHLKHPENTVKDVKDTEEDSYETRPQNVYLQNH